ncbi:uncharacterized protein LOC116843871 isoform X2 [Odontomachus brunneus]|nr:uncharacterized protein LOC116843871 isoform X2 [Odontomachus brunneus]
MVSSSYNQTLDYSSDKNTLSFDSNMTACSAPFLDYDHYDYDEYHEYDDYYINNTIQEEDFENDKKILEKESLVDLPKGTFGGLSLQECLDNIEKYGRAIQMLHLGEKSIDSGISSDNLNVDDDNKKIAGQLIGNCVDSKNTTEESNIIVCANAEKHIKNKERRHDGNVMSYVDSTEKLLREELDVVTEPNDCRSNDSEIKNDINLLKCAKGNTKNMSCNVNIEEDDTREAAADETNQIFNNISSNDEQAMHTSNDERSAEDRMLEALSAAKAEDDQDDVMRRIIESCSDVSMMYLRRHSIYESSDVVLRRSSSECAIEKFQGDEFLPRRQVVSEAVIAKEDILKTIEEAKKILTDSPYWDTSKTSGNQAADCYVEGNSPVRLSNETESDEEREMVNETKNSFVKVQGTTMKLPNVKIERVVASESDVVKSNLERLAEITCPDRPKSLIEIHETIEKIAEEKRRIEERKKESLEALSRKFVEIEKLVGDHNDTFSTFDSDPCYVKIPNDVADDSDSLDEFQVDPEDLEVPLTKSEITENLRIEELERQLANEIEEHKRLIDEYQKIISTDLEVVQEAASKPQSVRVCTDENINEEIKELENNELVVEELQNETSGPAFIDTASMKADSESDDSLSDFHEEPEKTYVKGKMYDFDEKKHGVRMTEDLIRKHCKEHKLYQTPYLNDVLYLHYKGFSFIENLEKYTGLKCLWLENNGIREIANLDNQRELKCLFLHHNLIKKIENLDCLPKLDTLNLSHNTIRRIENLDNLKFLNTLNLSHNYLHETADIEHLRLLHALTVLDISHNRIDTCDVVDILGDMKSLRVVTLTGNPVLKQIKMYRKTMILKCKNLQYLDDRPVFPRDRACAEAWVRGGVDEEVAERNRWIQAEQKKINDSVMALINKRKLYKPVETSEKEEADKKKEEEEDAEDATKSSVSAAPRSSGLLDLERKKKSKERSFLGSYASSSSSSSDGELASDEENEDMRQKGSEESDRRRPMAEEERKVSDGNNEELLLPWKVEIREKSQPRRLVEEISESMRHVADDAEKRWLGRQILDGRSSANDPSGGSIVGREIADSKKLISESLSVEENEKEMPYLRKSTGDDDETKDRENEKRLTRSVSCDTSDLKSMLEDHKSTNAIITVRDDTTNKIIAKNYPRKSKEYPFGSKLSSIREEMREFCNSMDRFVDENKIVFKNGEVEGFWKQRMTDANSQTDSVDERETRETEAEGSANEEDKLRWWNTKERRLKVQEIIKKREDEAKEDRAGGIRMNETIDRSPQEDEMSRTDNFQDVYDLMTLKTCPNVFPESTETYGAKSASSLECEQSAKVQEKSCGVLDSLFAELRNCDNDLRIRQPNVTNKLMLNSQTSAIDAERQYIYNLIHTTTNADSDKQSASRNGIAKAGDNFDAKMDIFENKFNSLSLESLKEKKNMNEPDDESDNESFKTATSLSEDTQIVESNQGSPQGLILPAMENNDNIINIIKNKSIDNPLNNYCKEIALDKEERADAIDKDKENDKVERSPDSGSKRGLSTETTKLPNSQVKLLVRTMDRLSLERTSQLSRLTGKRTREAEDIRVNTKKSLLIEEVDPGRKSEKRKTRGQISERCRQHAIQEARKFVRKASPLIDKCITTLIRDTENANGKSRYYNKYGRRSLAECLTSAFAAKSDLDKGDSRARNNRRDKCGGESEDTTNAYPARHESMAKGTINSGSTAPADDTDTRSFANLLRQSGSACKSQSTTLKPDVSLYKEFCDHLDELESKKISLIKPDFATVATREQEEHEKLLDNEPLPETEYSMKKSIKPLIKVISESPVNSNETEQIMERNEIEEEFRGPQHTFNYNKQNVIFRKLSEETIMTADNSEKHPNHEYLVNSNETGTFSTSSTLENAGCKEERILSDEKRETNIRKSIEMRVAQEN